MNVWDVANLAGIIRIVVGALVIACIAWWSIHRRRSRASQPPQQSRSSHDHR